MTRLIVASPKPCRNRPSVSSAQPAASKPTPTQPSKSEPRATYSSPRPGSYPLPGDEHASQTPAAVVRGRRVTWRRTADQPRHQMRRPCPRGLARRGTALRRRSAMAIVTWDRPSCRGRCRSHRAAGRARANAPSAPFSALVRAACKRRAGRARLRRSAKPWACDHVTRRVGRALTCINIRNEPPASDGGGAVMHGTISSPPHGDWTDGCELRPGSTRTASCRAPWWTRCTPPACSACGCRARWAARNCRRCRSWR